MGFQESLIFNGLKVISDSSMIERNWEFPYDRFIEYGPEDEWFARKVGFGHEVLQPMKTAFRIGDLLLMHPEIVKKLTEEMARRNELTNSLFEIPTRMEFGYEKIQVPTLRKRR